MQKEDNMRKPTLRMQLEMAAVQEHTLQREIERLQHELALAKIKIQYMGFTERRFDQLLEGMCWGMKEAILPRRPNNG